MLFDPLSLEREGGQASNEDLFPPGYGGEDRTFYRFPLP